MGLADARWPRPRSRRLAVLQGFSLHADTAVHGHDRQGLERLCRYGARGPVAESRLRRLEPNHCQRQGCDVGVNGMQVGGARQLIIAPSMGYGAEGTSGIPGNSSLVFDVTMLSSP